jgi:hypothetical protein
MSVVQTKPHYMGKYQPVPLACCGKNLKIMSEFDPSQGPEGLGPSLICSRSIKKRAMQELLGGVRV